MAGLRAHAGSQRRGFDDAAEKKGNQLNVEQKPGTHGTVEPVVFEERAAGGGRCVAFARLNAERTLNSLSQAMVDALQPQLDAWARRDDVVCVVLHGSGDRAFCAGGDVVALCKAIRAGSGAVAERFFAAEYRLDHQIHRYPKPVLVWGHGTVMGGGLGLMAGASHRIVTPRSKIAMPEVTIGLFPDVGASWFLGRMPRRIGLFLGLTTTPMTPGDALWLGLADYYLESDQRDAVFDALTRLDWQGEREADDSILADALRALESPAAAEQACHDSPIFARQRTIAWLGEAPGVAAYEARLNKAAAQDDWFAHGAKAMAAGSPTSRALIHRQLARDPRLSIEQVFRQDLAMGVACTRGTDFAEGVRALLVDKDRRPAWQPARLADVDPAAIEACFSLPDDYERHPLADL